MIRVPYIRASLPPVTEWAPLLAESYAAARFSNFGPLHERLAALLEAEFAAAGYAVVPASNATSALTAALIALGIDGEVVIPAFTFPATLHAVLAAGCEPVVCDVDEQSWELSLPNLEVLLDSGRVRAVMPVRAFGFVRPQTQLVEACVSAGRSLIWDAAAAFGSRKRRAQIGSPRGEIEVVSFHATKAISSGEGGAIFVPREHAPALRRAVNFGLAADRSFGDGLNAKLDEVRSAIALASLARADGEMGVRAEVASRYQAALAPHHRLVQLPANPGATPWQTFPVLFRTSAARLFVEGQLAESGVETRRYYFPALRSGYTGRHRERIRWTDTPVADSLAERMLCLPVFGSMSSVETEAAVTAVSSALARLECSSLR